MLKEGYYLMSSPDVPKKCLVYVYMDGERIDFGHLQAVRWMPVKDCVKETVFEPVAFIKSDEPANMNDLRFVDAIPETQREPNSLECTITITGSTDSDQLGLNINFDPPLTEKDDVWSNSACCAFSGELIKRIHELMPEKENGDDENN